MKIAYADAAVQVLWIKKNLEKMWFQFEPRRVCC
jgi:hypothetical protein